MGKKVKMLPDAAGKNVEKAKPEKTKQEKGKAAKADSERGKAKSKSEKNEEKSAKSGKKRKPEKEAVYDLKKLTKAMEDVQEPKRFQHTLGVQYTAAALAMRYGISLMDAQVAGLLHDCAKCLSDEKKIAICEKNHMEISKIELRNPFLLHAKVGSFLAASEYQVNDPDILNAILYHTTGRPDMSILEKIIFIADYIEPGRKQAPNLQEVRRIAFEDLDHALIKILSDTLSYLQEAGGEIDPMTKKTYDFYCKGENKNGK